MWHTVSAVGGTVVTVTTPPANWYPDPQVPGQMRYWDGAQWTEHVAQAQPAAAATPTQQAPQTAAAQQAKPASSRKIGLFGARGVARDLAAENDHLRAALEQTGALALAEIQLQTTTARAELTALQVNRPGFRGGWVSWFLPR